MKELLEKISSFNLFNYLFPGIIFVALLNSYTTYEISLDNVLVALFIYYLIGLILNRIGSILIEPIIGVGGRICSSVLRNN